LFVSILMDPTAQDNNQKEDQNPSSAAGKTPQNPILPGQYVVAQDEKSQQNQQFAPPPPPPTEPVSVPQTPLADLGHDRDLVTPATAQDVDLSKAINQQLAGPSTPPQSVPPPPPPSASAPPPPAAPPPNFGQPDPTPFNAVPAQGQMAPPSDQPKSKIKLLIIIVSILILIGLVLGLVWFFVLSKKGEQAAKTGSSEVQFEEPSPAPNRETGGFGDLEQATGEAPAIPPTEQTQPQPDQGELPNPSPVQSP